VLAIRHYGLWFALISGFVAPLASATQVITQPFLGVRLIHETETSPRLMNIYVAEIDLSAPGISFEMTPRSASYPGPQINGAPAETTRQTTRQFANAVGAQLAINTAFYATEVPATSWANNVGLTASLGDHYSSWDPFANPPQSKQWYDNYFHDAVNISQSNQAAFLKMPDIIGDGYLTTPSTTLYNTVTGLYRLLQNNHLGTSLPATSPDPLTAIGLTASNKLLLVTVDGRQPGFSEGITVIELANLMKTTYGATDAIQLDGGGSTTMVSNYYNDAQSAQVLNVPSDGSERSVGSNLAVFALPNGDYNQNGDVDAADYAIWRKSIGGQLAFNAWRSRYGTSPSGLGGGTTVPEPSTLAFSVLGLLVLMGERVLPIRFRRLH
jgi:Phosphodiester glycosidase